MKFYNNVIVVGFIFSSIMELCGCYDQPKPTSVQKYQWETIDKICFTQCDTQISDVSQTTTGQFCFGLGEEWISLPSGDTLQGYWTGNLFKADNQYQFLLDGSRGYLRTLNTQKFYQQ
jgi:hypothetical protein